MSKKENKEKKAGGIGAWLIKHPLAVGNTVKGVLTLVLSAGVGGVTAVITRDKTAGIAAGVSGAIVSGGVITLDTLGSLKLLKEQRKKLQEELSSEEINIDPDKIKNMSDEEISKLVEEIVCSD